MPKGRIIEIVSCLVIVGSVFAVFFTLTDFPPPGDHRLHEAIGKALAQETLALAGTSGGAITVIARDTVAFKQPAMEIALVSFKQVLAKARVPITAVELIQVDPLRPARVPAGDFFEWIRKAPAGSIIVSFMGPPLLTEAQRLQLGAIKPKIIAFCPGNLADGVDLRSLFEQHLLHVAVVSHPSSPGSASDAAPDALSFAQLYRSVTPGNLADLPPGPDQPKQP